MISDTNVDLYENVAALRQNQFDYSLLSSSNPKIYEHYLIRASQNENTI